MHKAALSSTGGVVAAVLGSLCCAGPLLFVTLGVGAGLASTFEPLRPLFGAAMVLLLGIAAWTVYGRQLFPRLVAERGADASPGGTDAAACAAPAPRRRDVLIFWSAVALAVVFWTFPVWSLWLL